MLLGQPLDFNKKRNDAISQKLENLKLKIQYDSAVKEKQNNHMKNGDWTSKVSTQQDETYYLIDILTKTKIARMRMGECTNGHTSESETNWPNICKI